MDAMRSLLWLEGSLAPRRPDLGWAGPPAAPALTGYAFTELAVDGVSGPEVADALAALGFAHTGQHRSKPVQLWEQGRARVLLNASVVRPSGAGVAEVAALALESEDPDRSAGRAEAFLAPVLPRTRGATEADLSAVAAPDQTQVFFARTGPGGWPADFLPTGVDAGDGAGLTYIDHVALTQPFDAFDEAGLFYRSVLGLEPESVTEVAAPFGIVRSRAVTGPDRALRLALNVSLLRRGEWAPAVPEPQSIAFATEDLVATPRARRAAGAPLVSVPANYHDDLDARLDLAPALLAAMRECGLFYDEDEHGRYLHLVTEVLGCRVFFEVVQRIDGYDGYGSVNAPVRMAAHRLLRARPPA
jgi:4-hydroxyphenylpyruvate dioxygenase